MTKIFIDGSAGTTGLRIYERIGTRPDLELIRLPEELRKDPASRKEALFASDIAFLCLPDAAAIEAVALAEGAALQGLLMVLFGALGLWSGWQLTDWGIALFLRQKDKLKKCMIHSALWLLLGLLAGAVELALWVVGGLLFLALTSFSDRLVLRVEVVGATQYSSAVTEVLQKHGVLPFREYPFERSDLVTAEILRIDGVGFCSVQKVGSTLLVEVQSFPFAE